MVAAFVATGAFAVSFSGDVQMSISIMEGSTHDDVDEIYAGGFMNRARLAVEAANEDETFGAYFRIQAGMRWGYAPDFFAHVAYAWWQPAPMFWMAIGFDADSKFGRRGVTGWNFYRAAGDINIANHGNAWGGGYYFGGSDGDDDDNGIDIPGGRSFNDSFWGGFSDAGLMLSITPIPELSINVGLPFIQLGQAGWGPLGEFSAELGDVFSSIAVQGTFDFGAGSVALSYRGNTQDYNPGSIWAHLNLGMIDNLDLDIGLGFHLRGDNHAEDTRIGIGVGAEFQVNEDFGLRARAQFSLDTADYPLNGLLFDVLPFFSLSDNVTIFCSVGIALCMFDDDTAFNFHLNPWVEIGGDWAPRFFVGFRLWSVNDPWEADDHIRFSVPIGLVVNF